MKTIKIGIILLGFSALFSANTLCASLASKTLANKCTAITATHQGELFLIETAEDGSQTLKRLALNNKILEVTNRWNLTEPVWTLGYVSEPSPALLFRLADGLYQIPLEMMIANQNILSLCAKVIALSAPHTPPLSLRSPMTQENHLVSGEVGRALVSNPGESAQVHPLPVTLVRQSSSLIRSSPRPVLTGHGLCLYPTFDQDQRALKTGCLNDQAKWDPKAPRLGNIRLRSWLRQKDTDWFLVVPGERDNVFAKATLHAIPDQGLAKEKETSIHIWHGAKLRPGFSPGRLHLISIQGLKNAHLTWENVRLNGEKILVQKKQDIKIKEADRFWLAFADLNKDGLEDVLVRQGKRLLWFSSKAKGGWQEPGRPLPLPDNLDWQSEAMVMSDQGLGQAVGGVRFFRERQDLGGDMLFSVSRNKKREPLLLVIFP